MTAKLCTVPELIHPLNNCVPVDLPKYFTRELKCSRHAVWYDVAYNKEGRQFLACYNCLVEIEAGQNK